MRQSLEATANATLSLIGALTAALAAGCSTPGYSGPERPSSEVANIAVHSSGRASVSSARVDSRPMGIFVTSVDVLPGKHTVVANYTTELESCYATEGLCDVDTVTGRCEAEVSTLAGRSYLVTVAEKSGNVTARVTAKSYFDFSARADEATPGFAVCTELSRSTNHRMRDFE